MLHLLASIASIAAITAWALIIMGVFYLAKWIGRGANPIVGNANVGEIAREGVNRESAPTLASQKGLRNEPLGTVL